MHYLFTSHLPRCTGTDGIIKKIRETVGDDPVYLTIDVRPRALCEKLFPMHEVDRFELD